MIASRDLSKCVCNSYLLQKYVFNWSLSQILLAINGKYLLNYIALIQNFMFILASIGTFTLNRIFVRRT